MVLKVTTPKANKSHVCIECMSEIPKGDHYERRSGFIKSGQPPVSYKTCMPCATLRDELIIEPDKSNIGKLAELIVKTPSIWPMVSRSHPIRKVISHSLVREREPVVKPKPKSFFEKVISWIGW